MARRRDFSAAEWRAMIEAALLLPVTGVSLRLGGLRRTWRWLNRPPSTGSPAVPPAELVNPVAGAVARVSHRYPLYHPSCLTRSLVLRHLLLRRGIPAELRLGVSTAGGQFAAHAWVEYDGRVLNDTPAVTRQYALIDLPDAFLRNLT